MSHGNNARQPKPSKDDIEAKKRADDLNKQQQDLLRQQQAERSNAQKELNRERIALLRGRFGGFGGGGAAPDGTSASSLFSRLTGR